MELVLIFYSGRKTFRSSWSGESCGSVINSQIVQVILEIIFSDLHNLYNGLDPLILGSFKF